MKALGEVTKLYTEAMSSRSVETTKDQEVLEVFQKDVDIIKGTFWTVRS